MIVGERIFKGKMLGSYFAWLCITLGVVNLVGLEPSF